MSDLRPSSLLQRVELIIELLPDILLLLEKYCDDCPREKRDNNLVRKLSLALLSKGEK